jgi:glycosyltransferase involved in cell wall biosynthesis
MLPIYFVGGWHHKNKNGIQLIRGSTVLPWNGERDGIILTNELNMDIVHRYDNVIVGPGIEFNYALDYCKKYQENKCIIFNILSPWLKKIFEVYAPNPNITYVALPFPVDIDRFQPSQKKKKFFIYVKLVHPSKVNDILHMIQEYSELLKEYECKIFTYGSYQEHDYLQYIQSAEFGIWIGRHESQGFAVEEALSCNCPLFVYDITSMKDEYTDNGQYPWAQFPGDLPATAASYFDESCGIICKEKESLHNMFASFLQVIPSYTPRQFVLDHLTSTQFVDNIKKILNL